MRRFSASGNCTLKADMAYGSYNNVLVKLQKTPGQNLASAIVFKPVFFYGNVE